MKPGCWLMLGLLLAAGCPLVRAGIGDVDPGYGQSGRTPSAQAPFTSGRGLMAVRDGFGWTDAAGQLDTSFGQNGYRAFPAGFEPNWKAWLRLPDSTLLLGGSRQGSGAVVHFDPSGEIDPAFAGTGVLLLAPRQQRCRVEDLDLQTDGGLLVLTGEYYGAYYFDTPVQVFVRRFGRGLVVDDAFGQNGAALVADYRTSAADFPYIETYTTSLIALADGNILYEDDYSAAPGAPLLDQVRVRIRYLGADGVPSTQVDRSLDSVVHDWKLLGRSEGKALLGGYFDSGNGIVYKMARRGADGAPDATFGQSGFFVLQDAGSATALAIESEDERYAFVVIDGGSATIVARVNLTGATAGSLDPSFGQQGIVRLRAPMRVKALQAPMDGSLVLFGAGGAFRLLPLPQPSPGFLSFETDNVAAAQPGSVRIRVTRSGGSAGAVSVDFTTVDVPGTQGATAVAGRDYEPAAGTLTWADGDTSDKVLSVNILAEYLNPARSYKPIGVALSNPSGALWIEIPQVSIYSQPGVATAGPAGGSGAGQSSPQAGGGALDVVSLLLLALLPAARRRLVLRGR